MKKRRPKLSDQPPAVESRAQRIEANLATLTKVVKLKVREQLTAEEVGLRIGVSGRTVRRMVRYLNNPRAKQ